MELYGLVVSGEAEVITVAEKFKAIEKLVREEMAGEDVETWRARLIDILEGRLS